jgi:hypothetical protein
MTHSGRYFPVAQAQAGVVDTTPLAFDADRPLVHRDIVLPDDEVLAAWRRHVPDLTPDELGALLPLVRGRSTWLPLVVAAYRAGRADDRGVAR